MWIFKAQIDTHVTQMGFDVEIKRDTLYRTNNSLNAIVILKRYCYKRNKRKRLNV